MKVATVRSYKPVSLFAFSLVLAITGLGVVVPQYFNQVAHADSSTWYVDAARTDDSQCVPATKQCKTIQVAVQASNSGDTIDVAAGIYIENGQIVIDKNLTIIGADKNSTIIKPASDTVGAGDSGSWILVNDGVEFNLSKVKLDGAGRMIRQGIRFNGSGTVNDVVIQNIIETGYSGFAIAQGYDNTGPRTLSVTNSTFTNFGRVGVQADNGSGTSTVTISNNTFIGKGVGDHLDYGITVEGGSNATITGNNISNCLGVASCDSSTSAAIAVTTFFAPGTTAIITGNIISNSTDGIAVGYDSSDTSSVIAHNNQFLDNTYGINSTNPTVDATENWWGDASGPGSVGTGSGDKITANVNYKPWCTDSACNTFSSADAITLAATDITSSDATLNGSNGSYSATGHLLWVSTTPFVTTSSNIPSGVYSTPVLGPLVVGADFSVKLSSLVTDAVVTGGAHSTMPAIKPNTTYYYAAWSQVGGIWYPGQVKSFVTSPEAPILLLPKDGALVNGNPVQSWSAVSGATHYIYSSYADAAGNNQIYSTTVNGTSRTVGGNQSLTFYWRVKAVNSAGSESSWSEMRKMTIDNTLPSTPDHPTPADGTYTNAANLTKIDWSDVVDSSMPVVYYYQSSHSNLPNPDGSFVSPAYSSELLTKSEISTTNTPEGIYFWHVRAVDAAGNKSAWSSPWKIIVDSTAPFVAITSPTNGDAVRGTVVVSGTVTDNNPDHYYLVIKDSNGKVVAGPGTVYKSNVADWPWDTTKLSDGLYTIDLEARDAANNKSADFSVQTIKVTVDNTGPIVSIADIVSPTKLGDITPIVTANDENEPLTYLWTANPSNPSVATFDNTAMSPTFTVTKNGTYKFTLVATDALGNESQPQEISFTYTAPSVTAVNQSAPQSGNTSSQATTANDGTPTGDNGVALATTDNGAVLGAKTNTPSTASDSGAAVKGDSVTKKTTSNWWSPLGIDWYWWLTMAAGAIAVTWWFVAGVLRNRGA